MLHGGRVLLGATARDNLLPLSPLLECGTTSRVLIPSALERCSKGTAWSRENPAADGASVLGGYTYLLPELP